MARSSWITSADSLRVRVLDYGGSGSVVCVFIHGFAEGAFVWDRAAAETAKAFRCIAVDLRGHGESEWSLSGDYGLSDYANDVEAVLDAAMADQFVVIGHSLGAAVALEVAARRRKSVKGVALIDYSPDPPGDAIRSIASQFRASVERVWSIKQYSRFLIGQRPLLNELEARRLAENMLHLEGDVVGAIKADPAIGAGRSSHDVDALWSKVRSNAVPTLVVRGEFSAMLSRADAQALFDALPAGVLEVTDRAGHAVMADNPAGFCAILGKFLRSLI